MCNSTSQNGSSQEDTSYSALIKNGESSKTLNKSEIDPSTNNTHFSAENTEQTSESRLGEGSSTLDVDNSQQINQTAHLPEGFFDDPVQDAKVGMLESIWRSFALRGGHTFLI